MQIRISRSLVSGFALTASVLFLALTLAAPSMAQVLYGTLLGSVRDPSDAAVPAASVTVTNKQTGVSRQTVTDDSGTWSLPTLQAGIYSVRVTKDGFRTVEQDNIELTANSQVRADVRMQLGSVSESVMVSAGDVAMQTDRAEVKAELSSRLLTEIPVPGQRNYQSLFLTLPGIAPPDTPHSIPSNPSRSMQFSVNGANTASNNTRIDGASAMNIWLPHIASYVPALESIDTVNVVTNSFDAEQGLAGGAAVNVIIRSGTNDFQGALFHYHQGNWSMARNFFLPANQDIPKFVYNQFGGRAGGALIKNKLFYFGSYEATMDRRFAFGLYNVPTAAMRRGDLSLQDGLAAGVRSQIFDPASGAPGARTAFPGNLIPQSRLHPTSVRLMNELPQENLPAANGLPVQNFVGQAPASFDRHTIDSKVNWNINDKWTTFARLSWLKFDMLSQTPFGELGGPPITFGNPGTGFGGTWSGSLATTYSLSPSFIIDANFGYTLMDTNVEQPGLGRNVGSEVYRIPGTNGTRRFESGYPGFGIGGFTAFGSTENYMPYFRRDPQFQYVANASWLKGKHNIRFGMDIYHLRLNHTQPEFTGGGSASAAGRMDFGQGPTQQGVGNQFNSMGTFMLGLITAGGRLLQVPDEYTTRTTMYSFYVRDQWQASRKLTLSYGTRFEFFPMPIRNADQGMERFDFRTNEMIVCGSGGNPRDCGTKVGSLYVSPRLGLAYRLNDKTVIRSGFGVNWDPWNLARPLRTNFPILAVFNFAAPAFQWASTFDQGIPLLQTPQVGSNGRIAMPTNYLLTTTGDEFQRSYLMNWNYTIERDLGKGWLGQVGYVGSRAVRVTGNLNVNAGQIPGRDQAGQPLFAAYRRAVATNLVAPTGDTKYHSLQSRLTKRFSGGLQSNVSYTWGHANGIVTGLDNNGGPPIPALGFRELNAGPLANDRRHNLQITAAWELPFGKGRRWSSSSGFVNGLIGGWQVKTLTSFMTGTPFSITADGATLLMPGNTQRGELIAPVTKLGGIGRGNPYYDRASFVQVRPTAGDPSTFRFGNIGPNALRGPNFFNSDLGLFRQFTISESKNLQFRAEYFNWTNTPKFSNPNGNVNSGDFMFITGTFSNGREPNGDRILRLGLRFAF